MTRSDHGRPRLGWIAGLALAVLGSDSVDAWQDSATGPGTSQGARDPHEEIVELFKLVEREMHVLDRFLWSGSVSEASTGEHADPRSLLEAARSRAQREIDGITRILELADHPHDPSKGT